MSRFINFIRTTALGGLLVIVPIAIVLFVLGQLLLALYTVAQEFVALTGLGIDDALLISGIALLALVGLCFATGLLVRTRLGSALRGWFAGNVAMAAPLSSTVFSVRRPPGPLPVPLCQT